MRGEVQRTCSTSGSVPSMKICVVSSIRLEVKYVSTQLSLSQRMGPEGVSRRLGVDLELVRRVG